jgi:hypothetical protein
MGNKATTESPFTKLFCEIKNLAKNQFFFTDIKQRNKEHVRCKKMKDFSSLNFQGHLL